MTIGAKDYCPEKNNLSSNQPMPDTQAGSAFLYTDGQRRGPKDEIATCTGERIWTDVQHKIQYASQAHRHFFVHENEG